MDAPLLTDDFNEFLRLLNANRVDYLLVGGYAVGLHGDPRRGHQLIAGLTPTWHSRCSTCCMSVGVELRREREWQRRSLESIADATKISVERLEAIEAMQGTALPPEVYLRGHLRAYAAELGLDPGDITDRYLASVEVTPPAPVWSVHSPEGRAISAARLADQAKAADAQARAAAEANAARVAAARARAEQRAAMRAALRASAASGTRAFVATVLEVATTVFTRSPGAVLAPAHARFTSADRVMALARTRLWPPSPMMVAALLAVVLGLLLAVGSEHIERRFPMLSPTTAITPTTSPAATPTAIEVRQATGN